MKCQHSTTKAHLVILSNYKTMADAEQESDTFKIFKHLHESN